MRKFKFNTQLIILFFGLLCLSSALFGMIVIGRVRNISETQTYDRLESYIEVTKSSWHNCELAPETYDEDDETKYMDEDSYNDIMDDYEDMYDKD